MRLNLNSRRDIYIINDVLKVVYTNSAVKCSRSDETDVIVMSKMIALAANIS